MAPKYWMISNRKRSGQSLGRDRGVLSFWTSDGGALDNLNNWKERTKEQFKLELLAAVDTFPVVEDPEDHEKQKHVALFIHGYNNDWQDAVETYQKIHSQLFSGRDSLGACILFTWPSDGMKLGYLPDREDARESAPDLSAVFNAFYDWMLERQAAAATDPSKACRAKTSVIAHSMGNYVLQKAMQYTWTRKNQPLLVSLINQLLMVAADVDNDLFNDDEGTDTTDGAAIANLTYRVTALYTGRDNILGLSAGFKHFGKRRLGRSGLDREHHIPDNVWDADCTTLLPANKDKVHSLYFEAPKTIELMWNILRGMDRNVLKEKGFIPS